MFELILDRFAALACEGAEILSAEELAAWPQDDVAALQQLNLVKKAAPAKEIECPGCEEACLMPVNVYPAQDDRAARISYYQHIAEMNQYQYDGKECVAIRTGTYAVYDDYAQQGGFFGAHVSNPAVVMFPNEDKLVGFKDMRDAVTYVKGLGV